MVKISQDIINSITCDIQEGHTYSIDLREWPMALFTHLQTLLRSAEGVIEELTTDILTVSGMDGALCLEVQTPEEIERYCYGDQDEVVRAAWKSKTIIKEEALPHLSSNIELIAKLVEEHEAARPDPREWMALEKEYTITKKSMYHVSPTITYQLACIRSGEMKTTRMADAKVVSVAPAFQLSILFKGSRVEGVEAIQHILRLLHMIRSQPMQMVEDARDILHGYQKLLGADAPLYFFAPKPITLEQRHLEPPGYGIATILEGYAVTEKADGERMLLYIHTDHKAYLINNSFQVFETGIRYPSCSGCLIDGEFVSWEKQKPTGHNDLFMIFDVYIYKGQHVLTKSLQQRVQLAMALRSNGPTLSIGIKEHRSGPNIIESCREILQKEQPYEIDGLIFTPLDIPVFAYYPDQPPKLDRVFKRSARWDRLFKWKPAEQNSIDFLIEVAGKDVRDAITGEVRRPYILKTGINALQWEKQTIREALHKMHQSVVLEDYREMPFRPISHYKPGIERVLLPTGAFETGMIVEFAYDLQTGWKPLRIREDKTRQYRLTGKIQGAANDYSVALSIWNNIHNPVTTEMIMGYYSKKMEAPQPSLEGEDELGISSIYYARQVPREYSLSLDMLNFHNLVIKASLYKRIPKKGSKLLELACGKGGDLSRWEDAGFRLVVGVDLVLDNLLNGMDGAYSRVIRRRQSPKPPRYHTDYLFLAGDISKPLDEIEHTESASLWKVLMGPGKPPGLPYELRGIAGQGNNGFHMVSCQFAIHYFFKSPELLNGFLQNVSKNLQKNGLFVGTCMDGALVDALLQEKEVVEGRSTGLLWALIRKYNMPRVSPYGNQIDVYLEMTQQVIPEYLVDIPELIVRAKEHQLELVEVVNFSHTLQLALRNQLPIYYPPFLKESLERLLRDPLQSQFSFLNVSFIFKKV